MKMTGFNKRVYEMLVRIVVFASTHPQYFPKGSAAAGILEEIEAAVQSLSTHQGSQTAGREDGRSSTNARTLARARLRSQLEAISFTAKGLQLSQFWMSKDRSDRSLLTLAPIFASRAEPFKQKFIDSMLPPDFIDRLGAAALDLENAMKDQISKVNSRVSATSAIERSRTAALEALDRLDPMMRNLLRDDLPTLAVWQTARHIERPTSSKREPEPPPTPQAA
jgi:hypothetical protein